MPTCKHCKTLIPIYSLILFCPECGESIVDLESELKNRKNPKNKRNVNLQTLFIFIPFVAFFAAYRVKRLKVFIRIYSAVLIALIVPIPVILSSLFHLDVGFIFSSFMKYPYFYIMILVVPGLILVKSIRKWTIEWNDMVDMLSLVHRNAAF